MWYWLIDSCWFGEISRTGESRSQNHIKKKVASTSISRARGNACDIVSSQLLCAILHDRPHFYCSLFLGRWSPTFLFIAITAIYWYILLYCLISLFLPQRCAKCREGFEKDAVVITASKARPGALWHPQCFCCCQCDELLVDMLFFAHEKRLYCGRHHAEKVLPRCMGCDEVRGIEKEHYTLSASFLFVCFLLCTQTVLYCMTTCFVYFYFFFF